MTTTALVMMIGAWAVIAYYTIKFFAKVLKTPSKPEPDSSPESDEIKR